MAYSKSNTLSLLTKNEENVHQQHHHHPSELTTTIPSPSFSSSSSSSFPSLPVSSKKNGDIEGGGDVGDDEEIGYRTPTSPEHRIRPSVDCPPAPRKTTEGSERRKRKFARSLRREWFHLEPMSSSMEVDGAWLMKKKVRREEEISENY